MLTPDHQAARRYLERLRPAGRRTLRHLLTCTECRYLAEATEILDPIRMTLSACSASPLPSPGVAPEPDQRGAGGTSPPHTGSQPRAAGNGPSTEISQRELRSSGLPDDVAESAASLVPLAAQAPDGEPQGPTPAPARGGNNLLSQIMPHLIGIIISGPPPTAAHPREIPAEAPFAPVPASSPRPSRGAPLAPRDDLSTASGDDLSTASGDDLSTASGNGLATVTGNDIGKAPGDSLATVAGDVLSAEPGEARPGTPRTRMAARLAIQLCDLSSDPERARLAETRQFLADLMMVPPPLRRSRIRQDAAYHRPALVRLLLIQANALLTESSSRGRIPAADASHHGPLAQRAEAADLAVAVADELPPALAATIHPLLADALALSGRAWTQIGAEGRAERCFARLAAATPWLAPAARAAFCHGLAQLRQRQARFDEAAALFSRAADLWTASGDDQPAALARAQLGFAILEAGSVGAGNVHTEITAARALQMAHVQLDPRLPALSTRVALALACCLAALGFAGRAQKLRRGAIARATAGAPDIAATVADATHPAASTGQADPAEPLARRWWEARIDAHLGRLDTAVAEFEAVCRALHRHGSLAEAARASLDLAQVRRALGRDAGLAALGRDLLATFASRDPILAGRIAALFQRPPGQPAAAIDLTALGTDAADTLDDAAIAQLRAALWQAGRQDRRRGVRQAPPYIRDLSVLAELHLAAEPGR
jgi:tetratricopeptide (TPR) repeat protein